MLPYFGDIENQLSVLKKVEEKFKDNLSKAKNRRRAKNIFSYKEFLTFK